MTNDQPLRVLLVDDSRADVVFIRESMQDVGFEAELEVATDGRAALERLQAVEKAADQRPDLILLDVMMPNVNGWQVAETLKNDPETRNIPIVFLSARAMEADVRKGTDLGVQAYVTKPFDPIDLMDLVNRLIAERSA